MNVEVSDKLYNRFKIALEQQGEEEKVVVERIFKTYVYDVFSRNCESFDGLDAFMRVPTKQKK